MQKILAIDDKMDNLLTLSALLKNLMPDCAVITAQSGREGIEKAEDELPDIILLDVKMPEMDGFETCRRLMDDERTKHVPVIMITAIDTDRQSRIKALDIGANSFLAKPVDEAELISQVKVALRIKKAEDALREERDSLERKVRERTAALRESEEKYRMLVENISDVIFEVNSHGSVTYVSPVAKEILGYDQGEIVGRNFIELVYPEDRGLLIKRFLEFRTGVEYPLNYRMVNKSGEIRWVRTKTRPVMEDGRFTGAYGTLIDITDQKQAEEALLQSEEKFSKAFQTSPYAITITRSEDGKLVDVNDAFMSITGFTREEALTGSSLGLRLWVNEDDRQRVVTDLQAGLTVVGQEVQFRTKSGEIIIGLFSAQVIQLSEGYCILSSINDITTRKRAENELQHTLHSLRKAIRTTINVMVSAVETRDPYTAGHQMRSTDIALAIAAEMGLSQDKIDGIRMAGSIHDIGKLSIPAEILSKPTELSEIEYLLIKEHSNKGHEILKDVESPWPLAEIVLQHHERMDGSGYPRGLKGEEILMESRILAVADVVESMASHRPYRAAMGLNFALEEIEKNRGILYDEVVVDACLLIFREKGYRVAEV